MYLTRNECIVAKLGTQVDITSNMQFFTTPVQCKIWPPEECNFQIQKQFDSDTGHAGDLRFVTVTRIHG